MRFLLVTDPGEPDAPPPTPEAMAALGEFIDETVKSGILVDTGGMEVEGTKVRYANGKFTVTDGPFAEAKELIAGYAIVEVESKEQALEISRRFYGIMGDGAGRAIQMFPGFDPDEH